MSLRPLATHLSAVSSLYAPYTTTGGGGGGGSVITTSSIVTSSITAAGPIIDNLSTGNAAYQFSVGVDGPNNAFMLISAPSTNTAYADVRVSDSTNAPVEILREQVSLGYAELGYITNPAAPAKTGISFISSLNGGPDATAILGSGEIFPLGCQLVPYASLTATAPAGSGVVLTGFSTVVGHAYQISFQVSEDVTGVPNPDDRMSYVIGGQVLDTISHVEISTLQGANPKGRCVNAVFVGPTPTVQLTVSNNSASAQSTIITCENTYLNGVLVKDMGPTTLVIA